MDQKAFYLDTKPSKLFWKTALPGSISMFVSSLYLIFDSMFVGKFIGTTAFAALNLAFPLIIVNFAFADLIGVGSSIPISILLGEQKNKEAKQLFSSAVAYIFGTGLLMGILIYLGAPLFFTFMGADAELASLGVSYLRVYALFSPFTTMTFALDNYLRICGKVKTSMALNILVSIGTIILEVICILLLNMGIVGAAFSANVAMAIAVAIGLAYFARGRLPLQFVRPNFDREEISKILKNGSPAFLTNVAGRLFSILVNIEIMRLGGPGAVAVYGILLTVGAVVEQALYGVLDSLQPAIGYNYGARQFDRVRTFRNYLFIAGSVLSISSVVVMATIPDLLSLPFLEDLTLLPLASAALQITSITYLFRWISHGVQTYLTALERPSWAMWISLSHAFFFPMILLRVLLPYGLDGIWWNYPVTTFLTAILSTIILSRVNKTLLQ